MKHKSYEVQRQCDRFPVALPVTIRAGSDGRVVMQGDTVDYSDCGLRLRTDLPVIISQKVEVIINQGDPEPKTYKVVWVREPAQTHSTFEAGLRMSA
jgi:hypothetical protein